MLHGYAYAHVAAACTGPADCCLPFCSQIQASFRGQQTRKQMKKPAAREFSSESEKWAAFKKALEKEAADGGYELNVLMRHVFFSFDADNNGAR